MKFIIYLQCDSRYNKWMLEEIDGQPAINQTIDRVKKIGDYQIICPLFACPENRKLAEILEDKGVDCSFTNEEQLTVRFYDSVVKAEDIDAVIRVCGDQVLLDPDVSSNIIEKFSDQYDFFYYPGTQGAVIPDIVRVDLLKRHCDEIYHSKRYFDIFIDDTDIRRLYFPVDKYIMSNRANNYLSYIYCKAVIENSLDISQINNDLSNSLSQPYCALMQSGILTSWALSGKADIPFYNMNGEVNPWWAESAVNLVREKISNIDNLRVFEWGAGNSTLFWAKYAKDVVSIEHDESWYKKMSNIVPSNVELKLIQLEYGGDYCKSAKKEMEQFDIISIDGRDRVNCSKNCLDKLKDNGIIIWDNSDRDYYNDGYRYLEREGFKELKLSGIIWGLPFTKDYTSIFYRADNIWGL